MKHRTKILVDAEFKHMLKMKAAEFDMSVTDLTARIARKDELDEFGIDFEKRLEGFKRKKDGRVFKI
jgi:hypothetical protein